MTTWFSADYHLGHGGKRGGIIAMAGRPFGSVEEMNEVIIKNHNSRVKPDDLFIHAGDFCFSTGKGINHVKPARYLERLNGNKILISGSHDRRNNVKTNIHSLVINIGGKEIQVVHDPKDADPQYRVVLIGHIHTQWKIKIIPGGPVLVNVGCDVWDFHPVDINEILKGVSGFKQAEKPAKPSS